MFALPMLCDVQDSLLTYACCLCQIPEKLQATLDLVTNRSVIQARRYVGKSCSGSKHMILLDNLAHNERGRGGGGGLLLVCLLLPSI